MITEKYTVPKADVEELLRKTILQVFNIPPETVDIAVLNYRTNNYGEMIDVSLEIKRKPGSLPSTSDTGVALVAERKITLGL